MEAQYEAGSLQMEKPIKQIINKRCCVATVLYGQVQDISAALLEAHKQKYAGEWLIPGGAVALIDAITIDLRRNLPESEIHSLLRGIFE